MFQITKYLQFRNTPDGKPRVLKEGVDYDITSVGNLYLLSNTTYNNNNINLHPEANLSDCRPLLSVEIDGKVWTEGDIFESPFGFSALFGSLYLGGYLSAGCYGTNDMQNSKVIGSFFDDPKKYSKLLWDCSEAEGWEKIFKLLEI